MILPERRRLWALMILAGYMLSGCGQVQDGRAKVEPSSQRADFPLWAVATTRGIELQWQAPADVQESFVVYRSATSQPVLPTSAQGWGVLSSQLDKSGRPGVIRETHEQNYMDHEAEAGHLFWYRVLAKGGRGQWAASQVSTAVALSVPVPLATSVWGYDSGPPINVRPGGTYENIVPGSLKTQVVIPASSDGSSYTIQFAFTNLFTAAVTLDVDLETNIWYPDDHDFDEVYTFVDRQILAPGAVTSRSYTIDSRICQPGDLDQIKIVLDCSLWSPVVDCRQDYGWFQIAAASNTQLGMASAFPAQVGFHAIEGWQKVTMVFPFAGTDASSFWGWSSPYNAYWFGFFDERNSVGSSIRGYRLPGQAQGHVLEQPVSVTTATTLFPLAAENRSLANQSCYSVDNNWGMQWSGDPYVQPTNNTGNATDPMWASVAPGTAAWNGSMQVQMARGNVNIPISETPIPVTSAFAIVDGVIDGSFEAPAALGSWKLYLFDETGRRSIFQTALTSQSQLSSFLLQAPVSCTTSAGLVAGDWYLLLENNAHELWFGAAVSALSVPVTADAWEPDFVLLDAPSLAGSGSTLYRTQWSDSGSDFGYDDYRFVDEFDLNSVTLVTGLDVIRIDNDGDLWRTVHSGPAFSLTQDWRTDLRKNGMVIPSPVTYPIEYLKDPYLSVRVPPKTYRYLALEGIAGESWVLQTHVGTDSYARNYDYYQSGRSHQLKAQSFIHPKYIEAGSPGTLPQNRCHSNPYRLTFE